MVKYKRILLKLSGEALANGDEIIDPAIVSQIADDIAEIHSLGVQIGIVIGGGNMIRGASAQGVSRVAGDTMGMLATVINSIAIKECLISKNIPSRVLTAVNIDRAGELFSAELAKDYLNKGVVVILGGGTGNPFFTTDTAAALRCAEIDADVLLKATKVDGVYSRDPMKDPTAVRYDTISHAEALSKDLRVMDSTAFSFCLENKIDIIIFKLLEKGNLRRCVEGQSVGSLVKTGG